MRKQPRTRPHGGVRPMPRLLGQQPRRLASWVVASSLGAAAVGCKESLAPGLSSVPASGTGSDVSGLPAAGRPIAGSGWDPGPQPVVSGTGGGSAGTQAAGASGSPTLATTPTPPAAEADWRPMYCDAVLLVADPVQVTPRLDYIAFHGTYRGAFSSPNDAPNVLISDVGKACAGAPDLAACRAEVLAAEQRSELCYGQPAGCQPFTITTRGGVVERQDDLPALLALLGNIDTASEALMVAMFRGFGLTCADEAARGTEIQVLPNGYRLRTEWGDACSGPVGLHEIEIHTDGWSGELKFTQLGYGCVIGRRPEGMQLQAPAGDGDNASGVFLARLAQLEAAAVHAFQRLSQELAQLAAPDGLVRQALRSARDELRHAHLMTGLAQRFGVTPPAPLMAAAQRQRSPLEIALENAVEGTVREAFGALIAQHQAVFATDSAVAEVMRCIAPDELRHGELSFRIARWLEPQLSASERMLVSRAREQALRDLGREIAADDMVASAREQIGWPSKARQARLLDRLARALVLG